MQKIKVGIIGAGGYGGCGATELLINHSGAEITALMDKQDVGRPLSELYPHLDGFCDMPLIDPDDGDCPDDFEVVIKGEREASWIKLKVSGLSLEKWREAAVEYLKRVKLELGG